MSYNSSTEHLGLPQWILADPPQMSDFNGAFSAIDDGYGQTVAYKRDLSTESLNDVIETGIYPQNYSTNATTERNYPVSASGCVVNIGYTNKTYQYYMVQNDNRIFYRRYVTNTWHEWEQVYPTPQSGSNDDGSWIKFPDGTMICYGVTPVDPEVHDGDYNTDAKAVYAEINFPQEFLDTNYIINAATNLEGGYTSYLGRAPAQYKGMTNLVFILTDNTQTTVPGEVRWQAIGRWK